MLFLSIFYLHDQLNCPNYLPRFIFKTNYEILWHTFLIFFFNYSVDFLGNTTTQLSCETAFISNLFILQLPTVVLKSALLFARRLQQQKKKEKKIFRKHFQSIYKCFVPYISFCVPRQTGMLYLRFRMKGKSLICSDKRVFSGDPDTQLAVNTRIWIKDYVHV